MTQGIAFDRILRLAAVTGMRSMLGPALVAAAQNRPEKQALAAVAMGEMVLDKIPGMPARSNPLGLIPRVLAGAWVAKKIAEEEGENDPWAPAVGAAVALGVGMVAPMVRGAARRVLGVPDLMIGAAEDALALRVGSQAVGLTLDDLKHLATESVGEVQHRVMPALQSMKEGVVG